MTKDVLKYLQPNAAIPIDMETTSMLVNALKDAYAKQEPLAWIHIDPEKPKVRFLEWKENEQGYRGKWIKKPLYTTPPQRPWVGLTEERIKDIWLKGKDHGDDWQDVLALARAFEAELKKVNT